MAILTTDVIYRLSTTAGAAGDTTSSTIAGSLGKYVSTTAVSGTSQNNIFENVTGDENAASTIFYKCIFVLNNHATLTWTNAVLWLASEVAGGGTLALAVDSTAISAKGSASAQALTIANRTTAPAALSFTAPTTKAAGLSLGSIPAGSVKGFWLRFTTANTAAVTADGGNFRCEGDSAA